jgi:SulP family sulfate permease
VERPSAQRRLLADHSGSIHVMELTGFLFFGSAYKIMDDITARLKATDQAPLRYLILDFERVNGADSSALKLLPRVIHDLEAGGGRLLLSSVRERFLKQFAASGVKISAQGGPVLREDVDRALEWCEDQILNDLGMDSNRMRVSMAGALKDDVLIMNLIDKRGTERVLEDGEVLLQQDQSADGIYYVKDGRLRVSFFTEAGHTIRLREIGEGNWVGEVGYYLDQPASATVKAMGPCTVAFLSDETIKKLAQEDSETGRNFHLFMARLLAERLADSNRVIEALRD